MSIRRERPWRQSLPALVVLLLALPGERAASLEHEFTKTGDSYSFVGRFEVKAELDCLMDVMYEFEHISGFAFRAESVQLIEEGEGWQVVAYTYRRLLILENRSTWRRTLDRPGQRVVFEMLTSKNNLQVIPRALSSRGHYQISGEGEVLQVEYFQECRLEDGILRQWYVERAESEAVEFLREFRDYAHGICGGVDP